MLELRRIAAEKIQEQRQKAKNRFDLTHARPKTYQQGDLVLVDNEAPSTGTSRKLKRCFKRPFIIKKVVENYRYVVEDLPGSCRTQRHYGSTYASDGLKPWCDLPPDGDVDDEEEFADEDDKRGRFKSGKAEL